MQGMYLVLITLTILFQLVASAPQSRIIGGTEVAVTRHPYIVSIRYRIAEAEGYYHECAGLIYSEHVVITGAQCIAGLIDTDKVMIIAGTQTRRGSDGMVYPATKWIAHPDYNAYTVDYDIGIFIVDVPFDLTPYEIHSIAVHESKPATNRSATVVGWGYQAEGGPSSIVLEETQVPIVSDADCKRIYGEGEITERMICAGDLAKGGRDACQGDTGGPLIIDGQLVGLVSWGRGCGRIGYPTVYTYVAALKQWIDETIAANLSRN